MNMKHVIRTAGAAIALAYAGTAMAGGVTVAENGDSKLKFEGEVYTDLTNHKVTNGAGTTTTNTTGARVSRAYFTGKYYFNSDWYMRITTDVTLDTPKATNPVTGKPLNNININKSKNNNIFLKYAYVEGKLAGDALALRLGQSHTPWIDYEEHLWAHRYFSPVLIDHNHYDNSSDLGIGFKGKVADGMAHYFVTYTNGAGYSHPGKLGKTMDFDASVGVEPIEGLTLDLQYRDGYQGTNINNSTALTAPLKAKSTLMQAMITYGMGHDFRVGANYATNKVKYSFPTAAAALKKYSATEKAYALWAWGKFADQFGAFGRYEHTTNNDIATRKIKNTRYALGVEYFPIKNVVLSLGFDETKKDKGGVSNGKDTRFGLYSEFKY